MPATTLTQVTAVVFFMSSIVPVAAVLALPARMVRLRAVRARLLAEWRPALAIAALYETSSIVRGRPFDITTLAIFAWAIVGLALARDIAGFEPLPVVRALVTRTRAVRSVVVMIGLAIVLNFVSKVAGGLGMGIGRALGEVPDTGSVASSFPTDPVQSFFLLLGGAGIAEETLFRLVVLSLIWRATRNPVIAVIGSAITFGAYHLSPLDSLYEQFWRFPISQLLASTFTGVVWGLTFVKRGYETAVLGHTLGDWLVIVFLAR